MEFALRYQPLVSHLVVIGPAATGFAYSEHFLMREYANQQSKNLDDLREASVKDQYLIVPGHEAAQKKLREILKAAPQDLTHNDMPLEEASIFPHVTELRKPTLIMVGSGDIADNQAVAGSPGGFGSRVLPIRDAGCRTPYVSGKASAVLRSSEQFLDATRLRNQLRRITVDSPHVVDVIP